MPSEGAAATENCGTICIRRPGPGVRGGGRAGGHWPYASPPHTRPATLTCPPAHPHAHCSTHSAHTRGPSRAGGWDPRGPCPCGPRPGEVTCPGGRAGRDSPLPGCTGLARLTGSPHPGPRALLPPPGCLQPDTASPNSSPGRKHGSQVLSVVTAAQVEGRPRPRSSHSPALVPAVTAPVAALVPAPAQARPGPFM